MSIATVPVHACPLCHSTAREAVYIDVPDRAGAIPGQWSFFTCAGCGLVYQDPRPANLGDGYPPDYGQHQKPPAARLQYGGTAARLRASIRAVILRAHGYEHLAVPFPARVLGRLLHAIRPLRTAAFQGHVLLPRARPDATLLDVGCGNGRFLAFAQLLGWRVAGIEPDPQSAELARALTGAPVAASFEEAAIEPQTIDVITVHHVLEHAADPRSLLAQCRRALRREGTLGVVVPNWRAMSRRLFRTYWLPLEPARHLVMFDEARLRSLLRECGFTVTAATRSWGRNASILRDSWRLRFGRDLPAAIHRSCAAAYWIADALRLGGGSEIVVWARPADGETPQRM